ncbi:hypothetical protein Cni_G16387 [Canna indica]|uniref:FCP1 homology domain-containing protein n=1 Tax=Canna indica TaxID=4628 RepID=A0AAQ3KG96_9LILI|nr:hypothetical protein Cni_G16387 [Canna indica]
MDSTFQSSSGKPTNRIQTGADDNTSHQGRKRGRQGINLRAWPQREYGPPVSSQRRFVSSSTYSSPGIRFRLTLPGKIMGRKRKTLASGHSSCTVKSKVSHDNKLKKKIRNTSMERSGKDVRPFGGTFVNCDYPLITDDVGPAVKLVMKTMERECLNEKLNMVSHSDNQVPQCAEKDDFLKLTSAAVNEKLSSSSKEPISISSLLVVPNQCSSDNLVPSDFVASYRDFGITYKRKNQVATRKDDSFVYKLTQETHMPHNRDSVNDSLFETSVVGLRKNDIDAFFNNSPIFAGSNENLSNRAHVCIAQRSYIGCEGLSNSTVLEYTKYGKKYRRRRKHASSCAKSVASSSGTHGMVLTLNHSNEAPFTSNQMSSVEKETDAAINFSTDLDIMVSSQMNSAPNLTNTQPAGNIENNVASNTCTEERSLNRFSHDTQHISLNPICSLQPVATSLNTISESDEFKRRIADLKCDRNGESTSNSVSVWKTDILKDTYRYTDASTGQEKEFDSSPMSCVMKDQANCSNFTALSTTETLLRSKKKLIVIDLNGVLADINQDYSYVHKSHKRVGRKSVIKRPFCDDFLKFCFERFHVGVWSSRRSYNLDAVVDYLMGQLKPKLLFCWDQSKCTDTGYKTIENSHKPLLLKELNKLWNKEDPDLPWEKGEYSQFNTLLVDDSPYKAICNPPQTAIFPYPYSCDDARDNSLGPGGDLRVYLEGLAMADDVQLYVKAHPFGQKAINNSDPSWDFYHQIIDKIHKYSL